MKKINTTKSIKESLEKLMENAEIFKNLPAPETDEQVKDLEKIKDSMVELDGYLEAILTGIQKLNDHEESFDEYMEGVRKEILEKKNK